jgi:glucose/arabinose dehydrogenase
MKSRMLIFAAFLLCFSCAEKQGKFSHLVADPDNGGITLPEGFGAIVVADGLGRARHIAVNDNGDIYVMLQRPENEQGMVALRDTTGNGKADLIRYFGDFTGTGIGIHNNHLYFSSDTAVMRYALDGSTLVPDGEPQIIAMGFIPERQHAAKPFTFDGAGNIYVTVGAPSNNCQERDRVPGSQGMDPCPLLERFAGIWRFREDLLNQHQAKDGMRYASGIRHAVALRWNNHVGELYLVQHGRDQLDQLFPELYDSEQNANLPGEEFLLIRESQAYSWPYCYYDPFREELVLSPEYGGDGNLIGRCSEFEKPLMSFPAHYAPNDLIFYHADQFPRRFRHGAFIAFHGSWNRSPYGQEGYNIVFVPMKEERPAGPWEVFANGFAGKEFLNSPREAEYRPMGLATGPDGSLYVTDSQKGRIWRIFYLGK